MTQAVHLEGIRCDGSAHGGCQAGCLIFWKEAWLRREGHASLISLKNTRSTRSSSKNLFQMGASGCSEGALIRATVNHADSDNETYACQATELLKATSPLKWYDMRQYVRDIRSGNVHLRDALSAIWLRVYRKAIQIKGGGRLRTYYLLIYLYDTFQRLRGGTPYPWKQGKVEGATPSMLLNLRPGELVEVKTHEEILETINHRNRNRGLSFDAEMVPYCGRKYRVLRRVEKIIDEKTGKMIRLPNDCIVLDGVTCTAQFIPQRLFCPRSIYPYWREIWLKRVE